MTWPVDTFIRYGLEHGPHIVRPRPPARMFRVENGAPIVRPGDRRRALEQMQAYKQRGNR